MANQFRITIRGVTPTEDGPDQFDVLIEHVDGSGISDGGQDVLGSYPRSMFAASEEDLSEQIDHEVTTIRNNLNVEQHPLVGKTFTV